MLKNGFIFTKKFSDLLLHLRVIKKTCFFFKFVLFLLLELVCDSVKNREITWNVLPRGRFLTVVHCTIGNLRGRWTLKNESLFLLVQLVSHILLSVHTPQLTDLHFLLVTPAIRWLSLSWTGVLGETPAFWWVWLALTRVILRKRSNLATNMLFFTWNQVFLKHFKPQFCPEKQHSKNLSTFLASSYFFIFLEDQFKKLPSFFTEFVQDAGGFMERAHGRCIQRRTPQGPESSTWRGTQESHMDTWLTTFQRVFCWKHFTTLTFPISGTSGHCRSRLESYGCNFRLYLLARGVPIISVSEVHFFCSVPLPFSYNIYICRIDVVSLKFQRYLSFTVLLLWEFQTSLHKTVCSIEHEQKLWTDAVIPSVSFHYHVISNSSQLYNGQSNSNYCETLTTQNVRKKFKLKQICILD